MVPEYIFQGRHSFLFILKLLRAVRSTQNNWWGEHSREIDIFGVLNWRSPTGAPALGAGGRRFNSSRPDHSMRWVTVKSVTHFFVVSDLCSNLAWNPWWGRFEKKDCGASQAVASCEMVSGFGDSSFLWECSPFPSPSMFSLMSLKEFRYCPKWEPSKKDGRSAKNINLSKLLPTHISPHKRMVNITIRIKFSIIFDLKKCLAQPAWLSVNLNIVMGKLDCIKISPVLGMNKPVYGSQLSDKTMSKIAGK